MRIKTTGHAAKVTVTPKDDEQTICQNCDGSGVYSAWDFHPNEERRHGQTCSVCETCRGRGWVILNPEHQPPASGDAEPEGDAEMRE